MKFSNILISLAFMYFNVKVVVGVSFNFFQNSERYFICNTYEKCMRVFDDIEFVGIIPVVWLSTDYFSDIHFISSFQAVLDIMVDTPTAHVLVLKTDDSNDALQAVVDSPENSILTISYGAGKQADLCTFYQYFHESSLRTILLLHHEMPWSGFGPMNSFQSCDVKIISKYKYIFRNYYYSELVNTTQYIPLGATAPRDRKSVV